MRILIIQTAFIGDVILATGIIEKIKAHDPKADIHFLLRRGNENLLSEHPHISKVHIWDKNNGKYRQLFKLIRSLKGIQFDKLICLQRFGAMGYLSWRLKAKEKIGFDKNPFSFAFHKKLKHEIGNGTHEVERNHELIKHFTDDKTAKPKLYPSAKDYDDIKGYLEKPFIVIAPNSVWFTKEVPQDKWVDLIKSQPDTPIYLIGGPADKPACDHIIKKSQHPNCINLAGKMNLLQSAALISKANMNYTCDSAPMHLASAMNAPVTAVFCSTTPGFGFGPLSDQALTIETDLKLDCKPCGLHGFKTCPKQHFKCGNSLQIK
jgi:heptosyltransferase-2